MANKMAAKIAQQAYQNSGNLSMSGVAKTRVTSEGGPEMVSQGVNAMTQVTNSYEMVNVRDSQANSTKQTVYQMKSSRTAMLDAQQESK